MIAIELTIAERLDFQYLLPVQGSIATLDLVTSILHKLQIKAADGVEAETVTIEFDSEEISLMKNSVEALDEAQRIPLQALQLAKKILRSEMK